MGTDAGSLAVAAVEPPVSPCAAPVLETVAIVASENAHPTVGDVYVRSVGERLGASERNGLALLLDDRRADVPSREHPGRGMKAYQSIVRAGESPTGCRLASAFGSSCRVHSRQRRAGFLSASAVGP